MTDDHTRPPAAGDLRHLLHRLNNHLGIILAHAELLEQKAHDEAARARAAEIVSAALDAMTVTRSIGEHADDARRPSQTKPPDL